MQNESYPLQFTLAGGEYGSVYAEWADYSGHEYQARFSAPEFIEALPAGHYPETVRMNVEYGGRSIEMECVIIRELDRHDPEREVRTVLSIKDWFDNICEHSAKAYAFNRLMGF